MTRQHFTTVGMGYVLAEAEVDETQVIGSGGSYYPRLLIFLHLHFSPISTPGSDYCATGLDARLYHPNTELISDALPVRLLRVQRSLPGYAAVKEQIYLEFPLDARRIAQLEKLRDGKNLSFRLDLTLAVQEHGTIAGDEKMKRPNIWGLKWLLKLFAQINFTIPRSVWVERVLPQIGHGVIHIVELPAVQIAACHGLQHSFDALRQAQSLHVLGLYDEAVIKCRIALEPFFDYVPVDHTLKDSRKIPELKKSWQIKLGKATCDWLNSTLGAIKDAANRTAHSPNPHFDQFESQMLQSITTAVIAYAARTLLAEGKA
jgi:hypothetical protein